MRIKSALSVAALLIQVPLGFSCRYKKEVVFSKVQDAIQDGYWVDEDTIQLIVSGKKYPNKIPISEKTKLSCRSAKDQIKKKFSRRYPKTNMEKVSFEIRYTLYTGDGSCKLVVWYTKNGLKKEL